MQEWLVHIFYRAWQNNSRLATQFPLTNLLYPGLPGVEEQDEVHFLSELIKDAFLPETFTAVFRGGPPVWLEEVIAHARGRRLIYHLASVNTNSLLLSWAIQRILAEGHDAEVARIGRSLAGYFGVYHRCARTVNCGFGFGFVLQLVSAQEP